MADSQEQGLAPVIQNLTDAGCGPDLVSSFLELERQGKREGQLCLLCRHRAHLLHQVHHYQKQLDCLDYLIYQMRRESGSSRQG